MLKHIHQFIQSNYLFITFIYCALTIVSCIISYLCLYTVQAAPLSIILTDIITAFDILIGWYGL